MGKVLDSLCVIHVERAAEDQCLGFLGGVEVASAVLKVEMMMIAFLLPVFPFQIRAWVEAVKVEVGCVVSLQIADRRGTNASGDGRGDEDPAAVAFAVAIHCAREIGDEVDADRHVLVGHGEDRAADGFAVDGVGDGIACGRAAVGEGDGAACGAVEGGLGAVAIA